MKRTKHRETTYQAYGGSEEKLKKSRPPGEKSEVFHTEPVAEEALVPLTKHEKDQLEECEKIIKAGLHTFYDVGSALGTIRDARLYRASHTTFESYCRDHWGFGRSYASRVIGAAERVRLLPAGESLPRPINEFQVRPFLKLEPGVFPKAWEQAVKKAKGGRVTPSVVRKVLTELAPKSGVKTKHSKQSRSERKVSAGQVGQILALLQDAKKRVEKGESDQVLAVLEQIESVLRGPASRQAGSQWQGYRT